MSKDNLPNMKVVFWYRDLTLLCTKNVNTKSKIPNQKHSFTFLLTTINHINPLTFKFLINKVRMVGYRTFAWTES